MAVVLLLTDMGTSNPMLAVLLPMLSAPLKQHLELRLTGKISKMLRRFAVMALRMMVAVMLRLKETVALDLHLLLALTLTLLVMPYLQTLLVETVEVRCPAKQNGDR
jgi:hypothetical protein